MKPDFFLARRDEYLRHFREAEELAEQADDPAAKEVWRRIAQSYYDLAGLVAVKRLTV